MKSKLPMYDYIVGVARHKFYVFGYNNHCASCIHWSNHEAAVLSLLLGNEGDLELMSEAECSNSYLSNFYTMDEKVVLKTRGRGPLWRDCAGYLNGIDKTVERLMRHKMITKKKSERQE